MINAWLWWEKSKAIAFPACIKPVEFSRLRSVWNQNFKSAAHKHDLFNMHLKKIELEPATIWKVANCHRITSKKNTRTQWVDTWAYDTVRRCWSADTLFWRLSINEKWMYNIRLQASKLARKCEIKHWCACVADRRKVGWSVSGHVIATFSRMDRFSKLWGFELSPWSNKISPET